MKTELTEKAKNYAFDKHNNPADAQTYGHAPYSKHLEDAYEVAKRYIKYLNEDEIEDTLCAVFLHDTVEDTEITPNMIRQLFNDRIASIVLAVSNEMGWDKKEILFKTLPKIWQNKLATFVKLCDRIANTTNSKNNMDEKSSGLYKRYQLEYPVFRYALRNKLYEDMWVELDELTEYNPCDYKNHKNEF